MTVAFLASAVPLRGQDPDPPAQVEPADPPAVGTTAEDGVEEWDDLLAFEDLPVVISASREQQSITLTAVPVSVLSYDDVHYSGQTRIAEVLQFAPGVDMLRFDRNRPAAGIRGMHESFSDRTIALVNGRTASNPVYGGPEYARMLVFMEDIEQIEVVRGPGGAAWGPNAFNGVVNIITARPEEVSGFASSFTINELGDTDTYVRWAHTAGPLSWRVSAGYLEHEASSPADNPGALPRDFARNPMVTSDFRLSLGERTALRFGAGYNDIEVGDYAMFGVQPSQDGHQRTTNAYLRLEHEASSGSSGYAQIVHNRYDDNVPSLTEVDSRETEVEGQWTFAGEGGASLTVGGNLRAVEIDGRQAQPFQAEPTLNGYDELWAGLLAIGRVQVSRGVAVEAQLRGDHYSETTEDWSGRLTALYQPWEDRATTLRASAARAFRAPLAGIRRLRLNRPGFVLQSGSGQEHEEVAGIELGYSDRWAESLDVRVDGYYQRYEDLIGLALASPGLPLVAELVNIDGGDGYGVEAEASWRGEWLTSSVWYAFHEFEPDRGNQSIRALRPSQHKVGARLRADLCRDLSASLNYKYSSRTWAQSFQIERLPEVQRLDLTLAQRVFEGKGEVMLGVTDLLDDSDYAPSVIGTGAVVTPGRAAFLRLQVRF